MLCVCVQTRPKIACEIKMSESKALVFAHFYFWKFAPEARVVSSLRLSRKGAAVFNEHSSSHSFSISCQQFALLDGDFDYSASQASCSHVSVNRVKC